MIELKFSTKRGKKVYEMGNRCWHAQLNCLYESWSMAKQKAFDQCWEEYANDEHSTAFGIGNANTFGFTASWLTVIDGEKALRVETKDNSYLVWLEK